MRAVLLLAVLLAAAGCGDDAVSPEDGGVDAGGERDAARDGDPPDAPGPGDAGGGDAGGDAGLPDGGSGVPNIAEVLAAEGCPGPDPAPAGRGSLVRVELGGDAICNDGSPAVIYVRRATSDAALGRWLFYMESGGACDDYSSCRSRYCDTPDHTSSRGAPDRTGLGGIFGEAPGAGVNQVFFEYCSSDRYAGQASDIVLPNDSDPSLRYSIHFRGHTIVETAIARLREGGVPAGDGMMMPDLDDATSVLLTGSSAGAAGVQTNADWLRGELAPGTELRAVLDGGLRAAADELADPDVAADLEANLRAELARYGFAFFADESCVAFHPGEEWICFDSAHVTLHHLTTPAFHRLDIRDPTRYALYGGKIRPSRVTADEYAAAALATLLRVADSAGTAEESGLVPAPAVFGPNCGRHIVLLDRTWLTTQTLPDGGGVQRSMAGALTAWIGGASIRLIDDDPRGISVCPP